MAGIDYRKIFDAAAAALNAPADPVIEAQDLNRYSAVITTENAGVITITAVIEEYSLELSMAKESFKRREYLNFMSAFEFNLEQQFYKNIIFNSRETSREYRIKISF